MIRIGTRGSPLALVQVGEFVRQLHRRYPNARTKVVVIKTSGDKGRKNFNKGLFVKEIEEALLSGKIDIAVHSLKDVPAYLPNGLKLTAFLKRNDSSDIFISCKYKSLKAMPRGASLGTSSPRRGAQARMINPKVKIVPIRGNVGTRIRKLEEGECDATIIAAAAIKRLKLKGRLLHFYTSTLLHFIPAIGQGIVCIETRSGDHQLNEIIYSGVNDKASEVAAVAERSFLQTIGGDCHTPIAAHATVKGGCVRLTGHVASPDGKKAMMRSSSGRDAASLGRRLGNHFISMGAREMIGLETRRPMLWTGLSVDERYLRDQNMIHLPMIDIKPPSDCYRSLDKAVRGLDRYDWIVFTSKNAVEAFACHSEPKAKNPANSIALTGSFPPNSRRASAIAQDDKHSGPKIAAVGEATAKRLRECGLNVALVPAGEESSIGLAKRFRKMNMKGKRVLFPRAKEGLDILVKELEKMGAHVDVVEAYRTVGAKIDAVLWKRYFLKNPPSKIFFSSPSGMRIFFKYFGRLSFIKKTQIICKGKTAKKLATFLGACR